MFLLFKCVFYFQFLNLNYNVLYNIYKEFNKYCSHDDNNLIFADSVLNSFEKRNIGELFQKLIFNLKKFQILIESILMTNTTEAIL